jgi:hypothetical protein
MEHELSANLPYLQLSGPITNDNGQGQTVGEMQASLIFRGGVGREMKVENIKN